MSPAESEVWEGIVDFVREQAQGWSENETPELALAVSRLQS